MPFFAFAANCAALTGHTALVKALPDAAAIAVHAHTHLVGVNNKAVCHNSSGVDLFSDIANSDARLGLFLSHANISSLDLMSHVRFWSAEESHVSDSVESLIIEVLSQILAHADANRSHTAVIFLSLFHADIMFALNVVSDCILPVISSSDSDGCRNWS